MHCSLERANESWSGEPPLSAWKHWLTRYGSVGGRVKAQLNPQRQWNRRATPDSVTSQAAQFTEMSDALAKRRGWVSGRLTQHNAQVAELRLV